MTVRVAWRFLHGLTLQLLKAVLAEFTSLVYISRLCGAERRRTIARTKTLHRCKQAARTAY